MRYAGQVRSGQVMTSLTAPPSPHSSPRDPGDLRLAGNLADGAVLLPPSLPPSLITDSKHRAVFVFAVTVSHSRSNSQARYEATGELAISTFTFATPANSLSC